MHLQHPETRHQQLLESQGQLRWIRLGWGRHCCIFSRKELHVPAAHALIFVQLALPRGTWCGSWEHSQSYENEERPLWVA